MGIGAKAGTSWRGVLNVLAVVLVFGVSSCLSHGQIMGPFREEWDRHDFKAADEQINLLLETGTSSTISSDGLQAIHWDSNDVPVFALEKSMTQMALGSYSNAVEILRSCRDELAERRSSLQVADFFKSLNDDTKLRFVGHDYEHMAIQVHLLIAALLDNDPDWKSYAVQIYERQQELIGTRFGDDLKDEDGNPVYIDTMEESTRSALGAYIDGILSERDRAMSEAENAYQRASSYSGGINVAAEAVARVSGKGDLEPGMGRVHVFYLAGRGPLLQEGTSKLTEGALAIAKAVSLANLIGDSTSPGTLGQAPVLVPVLVRRDEIIPPMRISSDTGQEATTEGLMDMYTVAQAQLDASMPWIMARAVVRRAAKAVLSKVASDKLEDSFGDFGSFLGGRAVNAGTTLSENADTRIWSTLPSEYHIARLMLPAGERQLDFGPGMSATIRVDPGGDTFVVIIRPNLTAPGQILVDKAHRVGEFSPVSMTTQ